MPILGTAPILAARIKARLLADPASGARDNDALEILCSAIAQEVIDHFIANVTLIVASGIVIAGTGGGPAPVVGATTAPGTGTIT